MRDEGGLAADGFKTTALINVRELTLFIYQLSGKGLELDSFNAILGKKGLLTLWVL